MASAKSVDTVQSAMLALAKRGVRVKSEPIRIDWHGLAVQTADYVPCSHMGRIRIEFLTFLDSPRQAVEMKSTGWFELADGQRVSLLRTWADRNYESVVEYQYRSEDDRLMIWNAFETILPSGEHRVDKMLGNAGFWVEQCAGGDRIYHCSHGAADPPNFESLVFRVSLTDGSSRRIGKSKK